MELYKGQLQQKKQCIQSKYTIDNNEQHKQQEVKLNIQQQQNQ